MKLPDQRSGVLPDGSASQPGKESIHFYIASLDPNQRLGVLPDGGASQARSEPVKDHLRSGWLGFSAKGVWFLSACLIVSTCSTGLRLSVSCVVVFSLKSPSAQFACKALFAMQRQWTPLSF